MHDKNVHKNSKQQLEEWNKEVEEQVHVKCSSECILQHSAQTKPGNLILDEALHIEGKMFLTCKCSLVFCFASFVRAQ